MQRTQVKQAVVDVFKVFKERYGAPRLTVELNENGIRCCRNHVANILSELNLKARNGKRYKYFPAIQAINHVSDNVLGRDFVCGRKTTFLFLR